MNKYLFLLLFLPVMSCTKGQKDTTYTYVCTTTWKENTFTVHSKDTTFANITTGEANIYAREHTGNGLYTTCERH